MAESQQDAKDIIKEEIGLDLDGMDGGSDGNAGGAGQVGPKAVEGSGELGRGNVWMASAMAGVAAMGVAVLML